MILPSKFEVSIFTHYKYSQAMKGDKMSKMGWFEVVIVTQEN